MQPTFPGSGEYSVTGKCWGGNEAGHEGTWEVGDEGTVESEDTFSTLAHTQ